MGIRPHGSGTAASDHENIQSIETAIERSPRDDETNAANKALLPTPPKANPAGPMHGRG